MATVPGVSVLADAASDVAEQLGISVSTLHADMDGEGQAKLRARKLLGTTRRWHKPRHSGSFLTAE